jgi:hypothetical protein
MALQARELTNRNRQCRNQKRLHKSLFQCHLSSCAVFYTYKRKRIFGFSSGISEIILTADVVSGHNRHCSCCLEVFCARMGCGSSAPEDRLQTVDDSVRVMLTNDKKRKMEKGEKLHGYVPRAEHPLFKPIPVQVTEPMDDQ